MRTVWAVLGDGSCLFASYHHSSSGSRHRSNPLPCLYMGTISLSKAWLMINMSISCGITRSNTHYPPSVPSSFPCKHLFSLAGISSSPSRRASSYVQCTLSIALCRSLRTGQSRAMIRLPSSFRHNAIAHDHHDIALALVKLCS
jgi:hypothetical protein